MKNLPRKAAFLGAFAVAAVGIFGSFAGASSTAKKCYKIDWCPV